MITYPSHRIVMKNASLTVEIKNAARSLAHSVGSGLCPSIVAGLPFLYRRTWGKAGLALVWKLHMQSTHLALPSWYVHLGA